MWKRQLDKSRGQIQKAQNGQEKQIIEEKEKRKKNDWVEYCEWVSEWMIKDELKKAGMGQIRVFLDHDKNFILCEIKVI